MGVVLSLFEVEVEVEAEVGADVSTVGEIFWYFLFSEYLSCVTLFYSDDVSVKIKCWLHW